MPRAEDSEDANRRRIASIVRQLSRIDLICSGTLTERTKTCGKPNCRCATDPEARHGPYHEWTWREGGKLMHKIVSAAQAKQLRKAIDNYGVLQQLLERWERESATIILGGRPRKP
jgi:hypothetical protein